MKIAIGFSALVLFLWFLGPLLYQAMKKHDYDTLYHGMQNAKRSGGAFVQEEQKPYKSYAEDYAYGRLRKEPTYQNKLTPDEKRAERRKRYKMAKWRM